MNLQILSDENLYKLCQQYGEQARTWRQKFAGLLPEVYRRKLYEKKNFASIFEFAKKLAGMSEEQVRRVLNIEKKFSAMPMLKALLVDGKVSVNKLAKVASIATSENEEILVEQVKLLPCRALETLIRDEKIAMKNGSNKPNFAEKSVHVNTYLPQNSENANLRSNVTKDVPPSRDSLAGTDEFGFTSEVKQKLLELRGKGIDLNAFILDALEEREQYIAQEKTRLAESSVGSKISRYIPVETRNLLKHEYGEKCSIDSCFKEADVIHHTQRFSLSKNHNPKYLAPLCKEHHAIAHSIDVKFYQVAKGYAPASP